MQFFQLKSQVLKVSKPHFRKNELKSEYWLFIMHSIMSNKKF